MRTPSSHGSWSAVLFASALVLVLFAAGSAQAGTIDPKYDEYLSTLPAGTQVSVIIYLADQAPLAQLNAQLEAESASRQVRHERVINTLKEVASETQGPLLASLESARAAGQLTGFTPYWISNLVVAKMTVPMVRTIVARQDVAAIEPNFTVSLIEPLPSNGPPIAAATASMRAINANRVWYEIGDTGAGALIGGLDTGVMGGHTALASRWRGLHVPSSQAWLDLLGTGTTFPTDTHSVGHGTHTMGTMCGLGASTQDSIGVAYSAEWIACNAINQNVGAAFDNDVIAAFQWFADPDGNPVTTDDVPDVVQNSWGINESFPGGYVDCDQRWWAVIDGCEAASCAVIFSAGNEGPAASTMRSPADRITTLTNAFAVGAVDGNAAFPFPIAGFSSRGPSGCPGSATQKIKPEVSAPGVQVRSSTNTGGYINLDGTSMAGPHVSGTIALMRAARPNIGVDAMKNILIATARDEGAVGEDNTFGWGVIDAYGAVRRTQCSNPIPLASGTSVVTPYLVEDYSFNQATNYWTAVAVRKPGEDWDLGVYSGACSSGLLANSTYVAGTTDFVIGDFNHNAFGNYYVNAFKFSGSGGARVEWDDGADAVTVNGPWTTRTTDATDLIEVWDVFLQGGVTYTFSFTPQGADTKLLLFRNPSAATYWVGRSSNVLQTTGSTDYTAPADDWYGVVVVNDNGASGSYAWRVGTCVAPVALASGASVVSPPPLNYYSFNQPVIYWSAVGVRASTDWDIGVYQNPAGGSWPACFSGPLAISNGVGIADFVIGDFNHNPLGTYYALPYQFDPFTPSGNAVTEWDDGADQIVVGDPPITRLTGASDVLEVWDVLLSANTQYDIFFDRTGSADTKLLVFQSQSATYWVPRSSAQLSTTSLHTLFTAPADDWYGIVVVNDNGADGQYRVAISPPALATDNGPQAAPRLTALHQTVPNPARGSVEISFDLANRESVDLQILDVSGRLVTNLPARDWEAGRWHTQWNLRAGDGGRVPAGVYWVRMATGSREVGRNKFIVLR
jgi:subtilisin family serine protease